MRKILLILTIHALLGNIARSNSLDSIHYAYIKGLCVYELYLDSVVNGYYLNKSTFYLNSSMSNGYSIVEKRNVVSLKDDCDLFDSIITKIIKQKYFFNKFQKPYYEYLDGGLIYLTGKFYKSGNSNRLFVAYEIEGKALIIDSACEAYNKSRANYSLNTGNGPCHVYLDFPQIYFLEGAKTSILSEKKARRKKLVPVSIKKVIVNYCI